ncbi:MAG: DUF4124 domain-containing protein [Gammaproteobacteria bacterium]|nr:DUF4124 domain-containing protein [Gammaproteobacteria bacterium]
MTRYGCLVILLMVVSPALFAAPTATPTPAAVTGGSKVYKSTGPNGEVIYSDQPDKHSQEIEVPSSDTNTFPATSVPPFTPYEASRPRGEMETRRFSYEELKITKPSNEETLWVDSGDVTLQASVKPGLNSGHSLYFVIDDKAIAANGTSLTVPNLDRGSHTVSAEIRDAQSSVIETSPPVIFYLRRPTIKTAPDNAHQ